MQRVRDRLPSFINGLDAAVALFAPHFDDAGDERLCVAHLDPKRRLIALCRGDAVHRRQIDFPLRQITHDALAFGTTGLILAHNHPSGDPAPSAADLQVSRRLVQVARALEIAVLDHLIFGRNGVVSFRSDGLL